MKAIVLQAFGSASHFKLQQMEMPQPKKGELRIRVKAASFNPVDYKIRQGIYGGKTPLILGADCSGIVDSLGPEVKGFAVGDEIIALCFGQCSNGSYAEFLCLPVEFVAKKPKTITFEQAASIPVAALTAYRAIFSSAAIQRGDTIFIAGAGGGVGSFTVQLAKVAQVKAIFTVAGSEKSAEFLCQELGIDKEHILLYPHLSLEKLEEKLVAMNGGKLFNAAFDFVGEDMKRLCLKLTAHSGHFVTAVPENQPLDFPVWGRGVSLCFNRNMSLHFLFIGAEAFSGPRDSWNIYASQLEHISQLIAYQLLQMPPVKSLGSFSVETVQKAHRLLEEGKVKGKLVMTLA